MNRRQQQSPVTRMAKGQPCLIRLPGICGGNPETTVPCHFRMSGLSGTSFIPDAIFIAFGCFQCHNYVDSHKDAETQLAFAQGVFRTQAYLIQKGKVKVEGQEGRAP